MSQAQATLGEFATIVEEPEAESLLNPWKRVRIELRHTARRLYWDDYDRDTHPCARCGDTDVALEVHHRDGDPYNNHLINLVAVCHECHRGEHRRRNTHRDLQEWKREFEEVLC